MILAYKVRTFFNLIKQGVTQREIDRSAGYINDGTRNDFPEYLTEIVYGSPTTEACINRRLNFVRGKGFLDDVGDFVVNTEGETMKDLHEKISCDLNLYHRFAIRVIQNRGGGISEIYHMPAEWVRYQKPDEQGLITEAYVNPYILTSEERRYKGQRFYPLYKLKTETKNVNPSEGKYNGHLYFFNLTNPANRVYSRPGYYAAEDYIKVDSKLGQFHDRNTDNNFFLGGILSVVGDPNQGLKDPVTGDVYSTLGVEFETRMSEAFSGAANAGSIMVDWVSDIAHAAKFTPWAGDTNHDKFRVIYDQVREVISISVSMPLILLGVSQAGKLGESQEIRNAIKFVNEQTESFRTDLEFTYQSLLDRMPGFSGEVKIKPIQDITDLPDTVYTSLSGGQRDVYLEENYGIEAADDGEIQTEEQTLILENQNGIDN